MAGTTSSSCSSSDEDGKGHRKGKKGKGKKSSDEEQGNKVDNLQTVKEMDEEGDGEKSAPKQSSGIPTAVANKVSKSKDAPQSKKRNPLVKMNTYDGSSSKHHHHHKKHSKDKVRTTHCSVKFVVNAVRNDFSIFNVPRTKIRIRNRPLTLTSQPILLIGTDLQICPRQLLTST